MKNDGIDNISEQILTAQPLGDLVRRSLEGDREAFGQIVRQYQGLVSGVTFGLTGDYHRSEDLAQETFIVAWKSLGELRELQKLPHWLCGIARNLVRNEWSRNASKPGIAHNTENAEKIAAASDDPIDHAIRAERNRLVGDALLKIPEKYRLPLVMSIRSGMTTPEIAATLEISEATFYQRISRAKKYLRAELEKQVEGAIRSTGPGDFFSLGVLAALPVAAMSTGCKATVASAAVAEPLIATVCTPEKCGPGVSGFLSWSTLLSIGSVLSVIFFWLSWVIGLLPGIWLSVRNAPTLRTRRYLILCSLRGHFLFMAACSFALLHNTLWWSLGMIFSGTLQYMNFNVIHQGFFIGGVAVLGFSFALLLLLSPLRYRRILREDSGLAQPKKSVPLEESFLSYRRLRNSYLRYGFGMLLVYGLAVCGFLYSLYFEILQGRETWTAACGEPAWAIFLRSPPIQFVIVGLLFLCVFREMHRRFLFDSKDEAAFATAGPIINKDTPFFERFFIEWIASFGFFLTAGFIFVLTQAFIVDWFPRSPFSIFAALVGMLGVTSLAALLGARFSLLRWILKPLVIGLLFAFVFLSAFQVWDFMGWKSVLSQDFFDSPTSWPAHFSLIVLDALIVLTTFTTLILGFSFIRSKRTGRFLSRRTIKTTFCAEFAVILVLSPVIYVAAKERCLIEILVCRYRDDWSTHHNEKMIALDDFNRAINGGHAFASNYYNRGFVFEKRGDRQAALENYEKAIQWMKRFQSPSPIVSTIPRPGFDEPHRLMVYDGNLYGYVISFDDMIKIRDALAESIEIP